MTEFIAQLPAENFFWLCSASIIAALGGFGFSFLFLHHKRLMEDTPTARVRSAHQGYVELEGRSRLMDGPDIIAPLTRTRCAWWSYRVEEHRRSGKNSKWVTIAHETSEECFWLEDATGRCVVDPEGAKVIPAVRQRWYGSSSRPDYGPALGGGWWRAAFCNYRYTEERIPPDHAVYAIGGFRTQTGGPEVFDEQADLRELLDKWKHDKKMMALLDINKDGSVDLREWEAARRMAQRKIRDEHVRLAVDTPDVNIMAKPKDRRPYILSGSAQAVLIRRYFWQAAGCLALSAAGAGTALFALSARGLL